MKQLTFNYRFNFLMDIENGYIYFNDNPHYKFPTFLKSASIQQIGKE